MTARRVLVGLLVAVAVLGVSGSASAQDEKVVLTIGLTNDVDTLNPVVGVEVPDYEVWNMMYATLTDKDADDFHTIPGLAESWEGSDDGLTYTYTLREGLKWSDGQPLTAEDVAYTVNRSREEEWLNYSSTTGNITATAPDERTVVLTSSVPDPKLPTMDVYIVPKHIFEKQNAKQITKYQALEGVGSGPFVIRELKRGQFWRLEANPNYWAGAPAVDEVVFRLFTNQDAMVAALLAGRDRRDPRRPDELVQAARVDRGHRRRAGPAGRVRGARDQRRARPRRSRIPRSWTSASARRSRTRSTTRR